MQQPHSRLEAASWMVWAAMPVSSQTRSPAFLGMLMTMKPVGRSPGKGPPQSLRAAAHLVMPNRRRQVSPGPTRL